MVCEEGIPEYYKIINFLYVLKKKNAEQPVLLRVFERGK
jgi:hypothetical protein